MRQAKALNGWNGQLNSLFDTQLNPRERWSIILLLFANPPKKIYTPQTDSGLRNNNTRKVSTLATTRKAMRVWESLRVSQISTICIED